MEEKYKKLKVMAFDFDGTLVDSQPIKLAAYYEIFPSDPHHKRIITAVLEQIPEASRFEIIREILSRVPSGHESGNKLSLLARDYGELVMQRIKSCQEKTEATPFLNAANKKYALFLNSNTPEDSLVEVVRQRGWLHYFKKIFGYPTGKEAALKNVISSEGILPSEMLVVGDGESDRLAAQKTGCAYYKISLADDLIKLGYELDLL